jgi:hypothetical protein
VCLYVYPSFVAWQSFGKHVPAAANTGNNRGIVRRVSVGLCMPLSLLCVGGVAFYVVRVVTKESKQLISPELRTLTPVMSRHCRSRWPRGLRYELSSLVLSLGSWVRIAIKVWMSVCVYSMFVLSHI